MVLKTTLQKESPKQSLPKVTSKAAVRRYYSLRPSTLFKRDLDTSLFFLILRNFYEKLFYRTTPAAFIDLLFLIKKNCAMVSTKARRSGHYTLFTPY